MAPRVLWRKPWRLDKKKIQVPNPSYVAWVSRDQMVVSYLVNSLSPKILAHVIELETSIEIWRVITSMCTAESRARVQHLRGALNNTQKLDMTPSVYFTKMKGHFNENMNHRVSLETRFF
jgi:hypothetical protein